MQYDLSAVFEEIAFTEKGIRILQNLILNQEEFESYLSDSLDNGISFHILLAILARSPADHHRQIAVQALKIPSVMKRMKRHTETFPGLIDPEPNLFNSNQIDVRKFLLENE